MSDFKSNNSTEFKAMGSLADGYTVIPNPVMNDISNMGADAFTILAKIFQFINNVEHKISVKGLSTQTKLTKDRVSKGLNKLIELGYIVREPKKRGNLTIGFTYLVYDRPIGNTASPRNPDIQDTEFQDTEYRDANKENNKHKNIKKENRVDVVDAQSKKLLDLYKSFKLEKKVMPHTIKLLKENTHISLEVFEQVFIAASGDDVAKKYAYIKKVITELNSKNIKTIKEYEEDNKKHEERKISKSKESSSQARKKTTAHEINQTYKKYEGEELEKKLKESQRGKFIEHKKTKFHNFKDSLDKYDNDFFDQFAANVPNDGKNDDWSY